MSIARRLAQDGAKVMVSSRRQDNVDRAVQSLRSGPGTLELIVEGMVCHVGDAEHRRSLIQEVTSHSRLNIIIIIQAVKRFNARAECNKSMQSE